MQQKALRPTRRHCGLDHVEGVGLLAGQLDHRRRLEPPTHREGGGSPVDLDVAPARELRDGTGRSGDPLLELAEGEGLVAERLQHLPLAGCAGQALQGARFVEARAPGHEAFGAWLDPRAGEGAGAGDEPVRLQRRQQLAGLRQLGRQRGGGSRRLLEGA